MSNITISIIEEVTNGRTVIIPVLPEKIEFSPGGTRFVTYDILDYGTVKIPSGTNLREWKWESFLPGENANVPYIIVSNEYTAQQYQSIFSEWRTNGTPLRLLITGTPTNHPVYLNDYPTVYKGPFGDYHYTIDFIERKVLNVTATSINNTESKSTSTERTTPKTYTHTVVRGDTLWGIARRYLGDGTRWGEIYNLNKSAIEETAKKYGRKSSNNGHWIYPGTVLHIPN